MIDATIKAIDVILADAAINEYASELMCHGTNPRHNAPIFAAMPVSLQLRRIGALWCNIDFAPSVNNRDFVNEPDCIAEHFNDPEAFNQAFADHSVVAVGLHLPTVT